VAVREWRYITPRRVDAQDGRIFAIILALAQPRLTFFATKVAVAVRPTLPAASRRRIWSAPHRWLTEI
jgi:hypothetical protein